jgi:hypothetical protein
MLIVEALFRASDLGWLCSWTAATGFRKGETEHVDQSPEEDVEVDLEGSTGE